MSNPQQDGSTVISTAWQRAEQPCGLNNENRHQYSVIDNIQCLQHFASFRITFLSFDFQCKKCCFFWIYLHQVHSLFLLSCICISNNMQLVLYSEFTYFPFHFILKFVSELLQVGGFLLVLRFPPPIKLTATI